MIPGDSRKVSMIMDELKKFMRKYKKRLFFIWQVWYYRLCYYKITI